MDTITGFLPTTCCTSGWHCGQQALLNHQNRDIVLIDSNGVQLRKKIPVALSKGKSLANSTSIAFFRQEHQLLLNLDGDIYEVNLAGDELEFRHLIRVKDIQFITCIRYYPQQGLLIIGSNTQGLFIFKKQQLVSVGKNNANGDAFYALAPYGNNQVLSVTGVLPGKPDATRYDRGELTGLAYYVTVTGIIGIAVSYASGNR
jgi:hypothetical protein